MPLFADLQPPIDCWVYLDNAASTPLYPEVIDAWPEMLRACYANPSAGHRLGYRLRLSLERQAGELLAALGIPEAETEVIWTSGGTEANNLAIFGSLAAAPAPAHALASATEHASVAAALAASQAETTAVPVNAAGAVDGERFAASLRPTTRLVSILAVQNETGVRQDLTALRTLLDARAPRALFHTDAVQAAGKLPIPWREARLDMVSVSGHKLHGPGGVGALIVRRGVRLLPQLHGGGQQGNRRSGSLDAAGIHAFVLAARTGAGRREALVALATALNRHARERLTALVNRQGQALPIRFNSPADASPFILSVSLPGYQGAILARQLGEQGILIGTGSACAAETAKPSPALTAMGIARDLAFGTLRLSFGYQNTPADIDAFADALQQALYVY